MCSLWPVAVTTGPAAGPDRVYCLLLHGYNALPAEFDALAERLADDAVACHVLRLPGDEGTGRPLAESAWDGWESATRAAVTDAANRYGPVALIGHSLGAALALRVAADSSLVRGVVALCPPLRLWPGEGLAIRVAQRAVSKLPAWPVDITPERRHCTPAIEHAEPSLPLRPLAGLVVALRDMRGRLDRVTCPALVVCARHDHVVPYRDGLEVYARIASERKELLVLDRSFHAVLHDVEQDLVERSVRAFCWSLSCSPDAR